MLQISRRGQNILIAMAAIAALLAIIGLALVADENNTFALRGIGAGLVVASIPSLISIVVITLSYERNV